MSHKCHIICVWKLIHFLSFLLHLHRLEKLLHMICNSIAKVVKTVEWWEKIQGFKTQLKECFVEIIIIISLAYISCNIFSLYTIPNLSTNRASFTNIQRHHLFPLENNFSLALLKMKIMTPMRAVNWSVAHITLNESVNMYDSKKIRKKYL